MIEDRNYASNPTSFKEIVMLQVKRVTELASHEMRGGYYTFVPTKKGDDEKEMYIADSREDYSQAVLCLKALLIEEFDEAGLEKLKKFDENLIQIEQNFLEKSTVDEDVILGEGFYQKEEDKILFETYRMKKLKLFQQLFCDICSQLARLNWMEMGGTTHE